MKKENQKKTKEQKIDQPITKITFWNHFGTKEDREYFLENLSLLISSGMGIMIALETIQKDMKSKTMQGIIKTIQKDIENGEPLWKSIQQTNLLPERVIPLLKIGEDSGKLAENIQMIVAQEQKNEMFKTKVKSGMMYPVILLFFTLIIGVGIAWFLLPQLAGMFNKLDMKLPLITKILINAGVFLGANGTWAIPLFLLIFWGIFYFTFFYKKTKFIGQNILLHTPIIKKLIIQTEIARMGYLMGTLLDAGIPIADALESFEKATNIKKYQKFYGHMVKSIREGNTFRQCFENYPKSTNIIPSPVQQMIITAESSEGLKKIFYKISNNFEEKIDITTKNLSVLLEPLMLIIIWVGVVFVALAVILPIYSLIGNVNQ